MSMKLVGMGILGIAGIAAAFVVSQQLEGGGDGEKTMEETKKEVMMSYSADAPVYAPVSISAPYRETNITRIVQNLLNPTPTPTPAATPVPAPVPGTGYGKFKGTITGTAGTALGYGGYVSPTRPTPVSPGYVPGVTTFKKYSEPAYIPSPVKPPSVSYEKTTPKKQPTSSGSYRRGTRRTSVTGKYSGR